MKCEQDLGFEHVNRPCALAPTLQPLPEPFTNE